MFRCRQDLEKGFNERNEKEQVPVLVGGFTARFYAKEGKALAGATECWIRPEETHSVFGTAQKKGFRDHLGLPPAPAG